MAELKPTPAVSGGLRQNNARRSSGAFEIGERGATGAAAFSAAVAAAPSVSNPRALIGSVGGSWTASQRGRALNSKSFYTLMHGAKLTAADKIRVRRTRQRFREIMTYLVFLFFFTISSVVIVQDQMLYFFGHNLRAQLTESEFDRDHTHVAKTFEDVATIEELFQWVEGPFFRTLYSSSTTTGSLTAVAGGPSTIAGSLSLPHEFAAPPQDTPPMSVESQRGFVFGANKVIGGIRVGQLRAMPRECTHVPDFAWQDKAANGPSCFGASEGAFSMNTESREPFGNGTTPFTWDGTGWGTMFTTMEEERSWTNPTIRTKFGDFFPVAAYPVILPNNNATDAWITIQHLKNDGYIDRQTRLVTIDITVYNPMLDMVTSLRLSVTFPKCGGIVVSSDMDVVRIYRWFETSRLLFVTMEVITAVFYVMYSVQALMKAWKLGWSYVLKPATVVHNINILFYVGMWVLRAMSISTAPPVEEVVIDSDVYYSFRAAVLFKAVSIYCNSINAFLVWFKLTQYLAFFPRFGLVTGTLVRSVGNVGGFVVVFFVLFYGFAASHMMTFGPTVYRYRNMTSTTFALLRALLGDFDLQELEESQFLMGPLLFVMFTAMAVFVVLNMLIAIISDAYSHEHALLKSQQDVVAQELADYLKVVLGSLPLCGKTFRKHLMGLSEDEASTIRRVDSGRGSADDNAERGCCTRTCGTCFGRSGMVDTSADDIWDTSMERLQSNRSGDDSDLVSPVAAARARAASGEASPGAAYAVTRSDPADATPTTRANQAEKTGRRSSKTDARRASLPGSIAGSYEDIDLVGDIGSSAHLQPEAGGATGASAGGKRGSVGDVTVDELLHEVDSAANRDERSSTTL